MSRTVKLVLMGVAGAALLYSCAPGIGSGLGALPYLWFLRNPFYRGPAITATTTPSGPTATTPGATKTTPAPTQTQRGGFGTTGSRSSGTS